MLGHEYGAEMSERGVPLKDTVEAFIFFRTLVLDSVNSNSWAPTLQLADRVLVGVVESYQRRLASEGWQTMGSPVGSPDSRREANGPPP